ncbi:hypothetical protein H0H81_004766 [Sphagnurus paluster]|uniref:Uncharacterized protein n=1 Tax=Sphagnurus paluster TaxID=117069 RepID=A0A9P7FSB4_9AGAR|nr:hypothetical protein H0H81_004766 [Sphagnurus paluster]
MLSASCSYAPAHPYLRHHAPTLPRGAVAARMPSITYLDLCMSLSMRSIKPRMTPLLASLPNLARITLPHFCLTTALAEHLSRFPHLDSIDFQYIKEQSWGDPADVVGFAPVLVEGMFPALRELNTTITYAHAARFFTSASAPTSLTSLHLNLTLIESPAATRALTILAETFQLLKSLTR